MKKALPRVIAIVGTTASGKTALGIKLARKLHGEVVSADSRQVYRGLNLGTGKVTRAEMRGVPHHLIDVADPRKQFTVADFVRLGRKAIDEILARGHVPIIVGGTGHYVDTLVGRMSFSEVKPDKKLRARLARLSLSALQNKLRKLDPKRYKTIDLKNPRRLIRAIEIASSSERRRLPEEATPRENMPKYSVQWIGIDLPKEKLKKKIALRLRARLKAGMLNEARKLHKAGVSWDRMHALGLEYRAMAEHLQGKTTKEQMIQKLETEIGQYAKRQRTWFKRNKDIEWR